MYSVGGLQFQSVAGFQHVRVGLSDDQRIGLLQLARPGKSNAFHEELWSEFPKAVEVLVSSGSANLRVVVLCAQGRNFCAGIDIAALNALVASMTDSHCPGLSREQLRWNIKKMQDAYTCLESCPVPVIAAVQGACFGAGVDMSTACDLRYCSEDAMFSVKEVDLGITADLGTLQRLPHIVGHGTAMELALTARSVPGREAERLGLVSHCFQTSDALLEGVMKVATTIADKPALAVRGTKRILQYSRSHSVEDGLDYVATWNSSMLLSKDLLAAAQAARRQAQPRSKL